MSTLDALYTVADSDNEALMWMMTKNEMCQSNPPHTSWMAVKLEEVVSPLVTMQFTIRWPESGISGLVNLDAPDKSIGLLIGRSCRGFVCVLVKCYAIYRCLLVSEREAWICFLAIVTLASNATTD